MIKDAIRLEYAFKRETYKKEMRAPSLRKASISDRKTTETELPIINSTDNNLQNKLCKSITKKGKKCSNKCLPNSLYCGILSHQMSSDNLTFD